MRLSKVLALLGVGAALSGCVSSSVAATVNGKAISSSELLNEVNSITSNQGFVKQLESSQQVFGQGIGNSTYDMTFVDEVLNRRISMDLIDQEAKKLGVHLTSQDIALGRVDAEQSFGGASVFSQFPQQYQAQLIKDSATLDVVEARLVHANISLSALQSYFNANPAQFENICSSQILVSTQAQANSIYQQLQNHANFAALAKADSGDPNTAPNGGAVGCGTYADYASTLGSQYAQVVMNLGSNTIAPPAHLPTGWSIIEVTSRTVLPFDQLTPQIRAAILGSKGQTAITNLLSKDSKAASISVNSRYGLITSTSNGSGVSPLPSSPPSALNFFVPSAG
ncbi:MAG: hypothetical protein HKL84_09605 [Acidimicrobiaceae bacterium]|nr:hypothetical protein [Acidimicrobiaceae bacterium]